MSRIFNQQNPLECFKNLIQRVNSWTPNKHQQNARNKSIHLKHKLTILNLFYTRIKIEICLEHVLNVN